MNWQVTGDLRIHIAGVLENSILAHCYTYSSRWVGTAIVSYYMIKSDSDLYYELIQVHIVNHALKKLIYGSWMIKGPHSHGF